MARKKVKFSGRFFVIVSVFFVLVVLIVVLLFSQKGEMRITAGTLEYKSKMKTVIVRNEKVVNADNWGKINFIASEGALVNQGDKIAQVFKAGYNERALQDLNDVQKNITDYIEQKQKGIINQDLTTLENKIDTLLQNISKVVRGEEDGDILSLEKDLIGQMQARQSLLRTLVKNDDTLNGLLAKEATYQDKIKAWEYDVQAEESGMVSFYFDGCEAFLTPDNINSLTRDDIKNLLNGTYKQKSSGSTTSVSLPLYRIVNNNDWYCLFLVDDINSKEFINGEKYSITFDGYYTQPYEAQVIAAKNLDLSTLFVMHITEDIGSLLGTRQAVANISKVFNGNIVPLQAITKNKNNVEGIKITEGNEEVFVPITIKYSDGENAVIESSNGTQLSPNERIY